MVNKLKQPAGTHPRKSWPEIPSPEDISADSATGSQIDLLLIRKQSKWCLWKHDYMTLDD